MAFLTRIPPPDWQYARLGVPSPASSPAPAAPPSSAPPTDPASKPVLVPRSKNVGTGMLIIVGVPTLLFVIERSLGLI